jgi:hypothetical protein
VKPFPILGSVLTILSIGNPRGLADADINRSPRPSSGRDVDPRPGGAVIKAIQEHHLPVEEPTETEMASVFEEVAAYDPATLEVAVTIEIAIPFGSVEQTPVAVAKAVAIPIAEAVAIPVKFLVR